jgi:hypothetical protein
MAHPVTSDPAFDVLYPLWYFEATNRNFLADSKSRSILGMKKGAIIKPNM